MGWRELVIVAWFCDRCGIEVLGDDALPQGWRLEDPDHVACAVCVGALVGR